MISALACLDTNLVHLLSYYEVHIVLLFLLRIHSLNLLSQLSFEPFE